MKLIRTTHLSNVNKKQIFDLWNIEYPIGLQYSQIADFESYLGSLMGKCHILLLNEKKHVIGWYVHFYREQERWFAMILDTNYQGKGWGSAILKLAKEKENSLNAWVIDHNRDVRASGEIYRSPLDFYLKNGFNLVPDIRLELPNISAVQVNWSK